MSYLKHIGLILLALTSTGWSLEYRWNNFTGTAGSWTDPANWIQTNGVYNGLVPGAGDRVFTAGDPSDWAFVSVLPVDTNDIWGYDMGSDGWRLIQQTDSYSHWTHQIININAGDDVAMNQFRGGNGGHLSRATVNIYGQMTVTGSAFDLERSHYSSVEFNQYAGSVVNATGSNGLRIGYKSYRAIYNMYGGVLNTTNISIPDGQSGYAMSNNIGAVYTRDGIACYTMAKAELNLYGGDIYTGVLALNYLASPSGVIRIRDGVLHIAGNVQYMIPLYLYYNAIVPVDEGDTIDYYFDGTYTVVRAIPEPLSLLLGCAGCGFVFRRQRRGILPCR